MSRKILVCLGLAATILYGSRAVVAQEVDASLPKALTLEKSRDVGMVADEYRKAIVLIYNPKIGLGTGFVISREHRLIATNAHVADLYSEGGSKAFVAVNHSNQKYGIKQVWYHPGVVRKSKGIWLRGPWLSNANEVHPLCPDVAIIQLKDDGPDLPKAFVLASPAEVASLYGKRIGMMGFPGHDNHRMPEVDETVEATFREGVVSRLTGFDFKVSDNDKYNQFMQHSLTSWAGFSGSPLFLANGHVIGLNNSGRTEKRGESSINLAYGIRVDALWELIAFHDDLRPLLAIPVKASELDLPRFSKPWEPDTKSRKAMELVEVAAGKAVRGGDHESGLRDLETAESLAPDYPDIYLKRGVLYRCLAFDKHRAGAVTEMRTLYAKSLQALQRCLELNPGNAEAYCELFASLNNLSGITNGAFDKELRTGITKFLESDILKAKVESNKYFGREPVASLYFYRAFARADNARIDDFNKAIELLENDTSNETWVQYLEARARYWRSVGNFEKEREDLERAKHYRPK